MVTAGPWVSLADTSAVQIVYWWLGHPKSAPTPLLRTDVRRRCGQTVVRRSSRPGRRRPNRLDSLEPTSGFEPLTC